MFNVLQVGRKDGSFGIDTYTIKDGDGELVIDDILKDGAYTYGYPIFKELDTYTYEIEGYEEYINADNSAMHSTVPMADVVVSISNALSAEYAVYGEGNADGATPGSVYDLQPGKLKLDSLGQATYKWKAGMPNITPPYSRTLEIYYTIGEDTKPWSGNKLGGIILGSLPTGNNFVTAGPDQLDMILRDPPGSGSSAEWTTGTTVSKSHSEGGTWTCEIETKTTSYLGAKTDVGVGVVGVFKFESLEAVNNLEVGLKASTEGEDASTWSREVTATKTITTSDSEDYVGAQGDVFIGSSTNIIYGKARDVDFYRNRNAQDGEPKAILQLNDIITTGLDFKTEFAYTQNYIENVLIPGFQKMRNAKLQTVSNIGDSNPSNHPIYLTKLDANDQRFGSSNHDKEVWGDSASEGPSTNGPSYKMIRPDNAKADENFQDSVEWCNNQIDIWKTYLAYNEQEKVQAFKQRTNDTPNYSFDGGTTVTNSIEKSQSKGDTYDITVSAAAILGDRFAARFNETGVIWEISTETGGGWHLQTENNTQQTESFSYTLAEDGIDALTVDVYDYGAFGPIFRTRGGQTSNPYEGEVVTKYYRPGTTIMEATMQIEVPEINAVPHILSDVPTGTAANFTLELSNKSEISEDVTYRLFVLDETNTNGAELSIDGKVLTTGRLIKVPANQLLTKALQLRQTDQSVLEYDSIAIVLASDSQPEDIADTTYISARFVPSSSPVELAISTTTMNTQTGSSLDMTFSGFDRNYRGLKAFRLQYKKKGNANWTDIHEYVTDSTSTLSTMQELLPKAGATVKYSFDLESFADGDYLFRVVSVASYGGKEVYRYSDELALVKDMQRPRPLGTPEPTDGVLDIGDELSITFNETILKGELTDVKNFLVTGVLNGAEVAHETALSLQGTETTAQTEAGISLANKDFSIDAWVRLNGEGTILSHGQGAQKLTVGTDSDGKLLVGIAGETYTSSNNVPTGKWAFLTMNYKNGDNGGKLSATVAYDAATDTLFDSRPVVTYTGNGPLSVGTGQSSTDGQSTAIHELLLWDEAHDIATALANRSKTKNPATRHLIGYWKMDEGEGTTIRDYARNRHMTMADETWYLNNVNKALDLNGSKYLSINTASLPNNDKYNDYAVEFWMRGGQQNGETQLLQMGDIGLWLNEQGQLQLTGKGAYLSTAEPNSQFSIPNSQLNDNAWHHVALNVLRLGSTAVYVDGNRQLTTAANNVGNIVGHELLLGARNDNGNYGNFFKGQIDEVRVWNATLNADQLLANRKVRLTGQEAGLSIYYPFEKTVLNSYNQLETIGISENACATEANANNPETMSYSDNAPALRTKPVETNVSFNFTASDNKIVIELDEDLDAAAIEGCTLHFTVRDVRDENGNYSVPTTWTAFVNRNELVWAEDALSIEQQAETQSSVTATIVNKGGRQQMWTISGMPSWLQASTEYGTMNPRTESQVTFTVTTAAPIGKHEATVYLKGSNGIETPLTINVKVTGNTPLWTVNAADYEETMNLIGSLYLLDVPSEDSDDVVAAFINGECRGVAQPEYSQRYDSYFVTMDIYANGSEADAPVEFKMYDASTGIIYPVVKAYLSEDGQWSTVPTTVTFEANTLLGRYPTPVKLTATDEVEQNIALAKGWNWISLGVKPEVFTVENVFAKANGKVEFLKSNTQIAEFDGEDWLSEITVMNNREMYAVQTNEALTLNVTGHRVNPADEPITVNNGWSWVAFNPLTVMSLADALGGMKPYDDEIIKGQRGVAYYDNYEWSGSLRQLSPGQGYKIFGRQARTFTYPAATAAPARATRSNYQFSTLNFQPSLFTPIDYHNYPANMVVIAQVVCGSEPVANAEVGIFAGDECREAAVTDDRGMIYVTVPGNEQTLLHFIIATDGKTMEAAETVTYENDAVCGTPRSPFVIDLGNATAISHLTLGAERSTIFDLQGRRVNSQIVKSSNRQMKGVYIINGQKMVK
ncbi:MAG: hypothetical protein II949_07050 [Prevotella sp.]|nr:hypothetical protein [Prevotella sp.]